MAKITALALLPFGTLLLAAGLCMWLFSQTANQGIRMWKNEESLKRTDPQLIVRPMPKINDSNLIWIRGYNDSEKWNAKLISSLDDYYNPWKVQKGNLSSMVCSYDIPPLPGRVCAVDVRDWGPCSREQNFGYHIGRPCILLELSAKNGWMPEYYNDPDDLPEDMPHQLQDRIRQITAPKERNTIWVSCTGENRVDEELIGSVAYFPLQGFPGYYYPIIDSEGYLSPLVAVQFQRPSYGVLINIECRLWAKNIKYSKDIKHGAVNLELLVD